MSKLSIIKIYPENYMLNYSCLNKDCQIVPDEMFSSIELINLIHNMFETLYEYPSGVGLSANQVGILLKICVIDYKRDGKKPLVCINPEYIPLSGGTVMSKEQCISFPKVSADVLRYQKIKVSYQDVSGQKQTIIAEGFKSFVLQHEIDHLNGIVFINRIDINNDLHDYEGYAVKLTQKSMEVIQNGTH